MSDFGYHGTAHVIDGPRKEDLAPYQWIALCTCGKGIRCNSESRAMEFLRLNGCLPASSAAAREEGERSSGVDLESDFSVGSKQQYMPRNTAFGGGTLPQMRPRIPRRFSDNSPCYFNFLWWTLSDKQFRLLDLFCGGGGAAMGYARAGFEVVGVDHEPQPRYPFEFVQADALTVLGNGSEPPPWSLEDFDAIHASPPCQRWADGFVTYRAEHPDLITPLRPLLQATGLPYVIENVKRAPLVDAVTICAGALNCVSGDLQLHRHRKFEANFPLMGAACARVRRHTVSVVGSGTPSGNRKTIGRNPSIAEKREAMGIDWTNRAELSEAIPPAMTEYVGHQLLAHLRAGVAA